MVKSIKFLLKHVDFISLAGIFLWISFCPVPLQEKFYISGKAVLLLAWLVLVVSRIKSLKSIFSSQDIPVLLFIAALSVNILFAPNKAVAWRSYWDLAVPLFLIYYLAKTATSRVKSIVYLSRVITLTGIFVALLGVYECLFAFNPLYEYGVANPFYHRYITGFVRPMSTQMHTVPLGTYLLGCLPFNFILLKQDRRNFRLWAATGIILSVTVIILTFSRGVFFALTAMLLFYLFSQNNYRKGFLYLVGILIFIIFCARLPYPFSRLSPEGIMFEDGGACSAYLADRWHIVKQMLHEHPFAGVGLQHFRLLFDRYFNGTVMVPLESDSPGALQVPFEFKVADNMYQTLLAETGIIGFAGFTVLVVYFLMTGLKSAKQVTGWRRLQLLAVLSGFIGFLVNMAAYDLFYWPSQYIHFCIMVGILAGFFMDSAKEAALAKPG